MRCPGNTPSSAVLLVRCGEVQVERDLHGNVPSMLLHKHHGRRLSLGTMALVAGLMVGIPACGEELLRTNGNSNRGYFSVSPSAALAVDGWLGYSVRDYEAFGADSASISFELVSASNDQAAHISLVTPAGDMVVEGKAPGSSQILFRATADGERIEDGFTIDVRAVTHLGFDGCRPAGVYVRGFDGLVTYTFNPGSSPRVLGLGLYPFTMSPSDAVTLKTGDSNVERWAFTIPSTAPAQVRLTSSLPSDASEYLMTIIDPASVDGITPAPSSSPHSGDTASLDLVPTSAGRPVCGHFRRVVTSLTPTICQLRKDSMNVRLLDTVDDEARLAFLAAGTCRVSVSFPDLGLTFEWQPWTVATSSSGGGGGDFDWD